MTTKVDADFASLAASLRAATVRVHDRQGRGSGVVWDAGGLIVTNAHVVRGGSATVEWESGDDARAQVVRRDTQRDLAALRVRRAGAFPAAEIRDSATLLPGELVMAVGNPHGLTGALTAGLVQRCNARWVVADVRLSPGNSGGPLADAAGRVVGINSMVAGSLALAVPSSAVASFLDAPLGRRRLGVALAPVTLAAGRRPLGALLVTGVEEGSVAEGAGVMLGDAIVGTQDGALRAPERLAALLSRATALEIVRAGRQATLELPWVAAPEDSRAA